jgi:Raf kinase inhibitor-like YbhB/YbcL family protein
MLLKQMAWEQQAVLMQLASSAFTNNSTIPSKYTCKGQGVSPPLVFSDISKQAKSLAVIAHDPDAPVGDFVHWLIWNIPVNVGSLVEGISPNNSVQGINDFKKIGYGYPCPPSGTHRYIFELYSLDCHLDLSEGKNRAALQTAMSNHIIEKAELIGLVSA